MQLRSRNIALISILASLAVVIYVMETFIPRPLPWMRFGFGNIIVIIALYLLGFKFALLVALIKSCVGALIIGNLFTPAFLLSLSGGLLSVSIMGLMLSIASALFSPLGISLWGALTHNTAQLLIASFFLIRSRAVLNLFPIFLLLSVATGIVTGAISLAVLKHLSLKKDLF
ncbi:MAG: Gx transporter family protein [Candidatus Cloacimonadota bacterium]|nr:MAG: Gx transporter family protein [Candidatus Cloacimonadota bacterium]